MPRRPGAHTMLVADGAGWHGSDAPVVPDNVPLPEPPHAPELNPVESVWPSLRQNELPQSPSRRPRRPCGRLLRAWNALVTQRGIVTSITTRGGAKQADA